MSANYLMGDGWPACFNFQFSICIFRSLYFPNGQIAWFRFHFWLYFALSSMTSVTFILVPSLPLVPLCVALSWPAWSKKRSKSALHLLDSITRFNWWLTISAWRAAAKGLTSSLASSAIFAILGDFQWFSFREPRWPPSFAGLPPPRVPTREPLVLRSLVAACLAIAPQKTTTSDRSLSRQYLAWITTASQPRPFPDISWFITL